MKQIAVLLFVLGTPSLVASPTWTTLSSGDPSPAAGPKMILVGAGRNLIGGWNHIPSDPSLEGVRLGVDATEYEPAGMDWVEADREYIPVVLVRKLGDWDHQHANGLDGFWSGLLFEQVKSVVLDLRLSDKTSLPTAAEITARYGQWLSEEQLKALDASLPVVRVSLTGPSSVWSAESFIDLSPAQGTWMRLEIPVADLGLFRGPRTQKRPLNASELTGERVGHLLIEPEALGDDFSRAGSVARNFVPTLWEGSHAPPRELLKEIGIDLAAVYVRLN